jgi:hypothetical protein
MNMGGGVVQELWGHEEGEFLRREVGRMDEDLRQVWEKRRQDADATEVDKRVGSGEADAL